MKLFCAGSPWGTLYLRDIILFYNEPQLISAYNNAGHSFLIVAIDEGDNGSQWLAVPISESRLTALCSEKIPLRVCFVEPEVEPAYRITIQQNDCIDIVSAADQPLTEGDLPLPDAFIQHDLRAASPELLEAPEVAARDRRHVLRLGFQFGSLYGPNAPLQVLGEIFSKVQDLFSAITAYQMGHSALTGKFPANISKVAELEYSTSYPSSFGIDIRSVCGPDLYKDPEGEQAFLAFARMLEACNSADEVLGLPASLGKRATSRLRDFIGFVHCHSSKLAYDIGTVSGDHRAGRLAKIRLEAAYEALTREEPMDTEEYTDVGELRAINLDTRSFDFLSTESGKRTSGKIDSTLFENADSWELPIPVIGRFRRVITFTISGGDKEDFTLISLSSIDPDE